jgi:DNA-binding FadR family transcriptional regulator
MVVSKEKKSLSGIIIKYIHDNNFKQGDVLPSERKLSEIFSSSRNSIREALRNLEAQSILEVKPGSGCYVKTSEIEFLANPETDIRQMAFQQLEARLAIDPDIIQLAVERINDREIQQLNNLIVRLSKSMLARNINGIINDDNCFRMTLAKCTKNRLLQLMVRQLEKNNSVLWSIIGKFSDDDLNEIFGTYVKILNCVKKRDSGAAKNEVRNQITMIFNYLRILPAEKFDMLHETEDMDD